MEVTRIFDLLPYHEATFKPKEDVIASKDNGEWSKYSIKQYREIVDNISYGFLELGVQPGDKIAQISSNRAEWNFVDMAILQVGGDPCPNLPNHQRIRLQVHPESCRSNLCIYFGSGTPKKD